MNNKKVVLHNIKGEPFEFGILDRIEYENKEYVVLFPKKGYTEQVTILQYERKEGVENYIKVLDDGIANEVFKRFVQRAKEELGKEKN